MFIRRLEKWRSYTFSLEERKATIRAVERELDEADEIVRNRSIFLYTYGL